jgi:hypothetical protein
MAHNFYNARKAKKLSTLDFGLRENTLWLSISDDHMQIEVGISVTKMLKNVDTIQQKVVEQNF